MLCNCFSMVIPSSKAFSRRSDGGLFHVRGRRAGIWAGVSSYSATEAYTSQAMLSWPIPTVFHPDAGNIVMESPRSIFPDPGNMYTVVSCAKTGDCKRAILNIKYNNVPFVKTLGGHRQHVVKEGCRRWRKWIINPEGLQHIGVRSPQRRWGKGPWPFGYTLRGLKE